MAIFVSLVLAALEWRVVKGNVGAVWNGWGAVEGTLRRRNRAPMRYRVLVPWMLALLGKVGLGTGLWQYEVLKVGLLAGALWVAEALLGTVGMLALAVLVASTFEWDYWDCYGELLGVGLILLAGERGTWWLAVAGGLVWGLSRETALLAPVLGLLAGGWWCGAAALVGPWAMGLARLYQGKAGLYCERWTLYVYNLRDLALAGKRKDVGPWLSVLWTVATVFVCVGVWECGGVMDRTRWVMLAWLGAGWLMGRSRETRVFLPCALWMAGVIGEL